MGTRDMWVAGGRGPVVAESRATDGPGVVDVVLSWGDVDGFGRAANVLAVAQVKPGQTLALGERGDLLVPEAVLGSDRVEIVHHALDGATVTVPPGARLRIDGWPREEATLTLSRGHLVEITVGAFAVKVEIGTAVERPASVSLEGLKDAGAGFFAGSALLHAAAFAAVALFAPALGATEEDPFDADRLALMQRLLNASAQREQERTPDEGTESPSGDVNAGQQARGREGAAGRPEIDKTEGRWAAKGTARPESATLARQHELAAAQNFGLIGMISTAAWNDPHAPTVPWGTTLNGSDEVSAAGLLYGHSIADARGMGGLALTGTGEGGGGASDNIGMNGYGTLGHTGSCEGGPCEGIGSGRGVKLGRPHVGHMKAPRPEAISTNGRLLPEVIQRIVRLNDGRYRLCYENGLRGDPALQGRVTVKFMIDRRGGVAFAADGGSDIPSEGVRQCVIKSFLSLSFPEPDSGSVTVVYPIVFNPE